MCRTVCFVFDSEECCTRDGPALRHLQALGEKNPHRSSGRTHSKDQRVATRNSNTVTAANEGVSLAVEHGLIIRQICLRILALSFIHVLVPFTCLILVWVVWVNSNQNTERTRGSNLLSFSVILCQV